MSGPQFIRRPNLTQEELDRAKQMEKDGRPRIQIARALGYKTASSITRRLGAKRRYARKALVPEG